MACARFGSQQAVEASAGARVICFYLQSAAQIRLLLIYAKGRKDDLSADEKRVLRKLNERW